MYKILGCISQSPKASDEVASIFSYQLLQVILDKNEP